MKKFLISCLLVISSTLIFCQKKIELFDLVKSFAEKEKDDVGQWPAGKPAMFPVKWKEDKVIMSEDTSINFYMSGTADIVVNNVSVVPLSKPANVMLRGPRSGYMAYNILIAYKGNTSTPPTLDSLFSNKNYTEKLIKNCVVTPTSGFNYYEVSIPKKNKLFIKMIWNLNKSDTWIIALDCNDEWSKNSLKLNCPK